MATLFQPARIRDPYTLIAGHQHAADTTLASPASLLPSAFLNTQECTAFTPDTRTVPCMTDSPCPFHEDLAALAKRRTALRYWLLGARHFKAVEAMEYAEEYHSGTRKDGVSPEFSHQVSIVSFLRAFDAQLMYPDDTYATGFLHDVREDYDVPDAEIRTRFGTRTADATDALTKVFRGVTREPSAVFTAIAHDPVASVVKGADRINNQRTMLGVFTPDKVRRYISETSTMFFPMLKTARRVFPAQDGVYELEKLMLSTQVELYCALL